MPFSDDSLNFFLNALPAVLYEFVRHPDGSGEMNYVSPNSKAILGYPPDYFTGNGGGKWDFIHPDDVERFRIESRSTDLFTIAVRVVWPSGETRWVRIRSSPERKEANGDVVWAGCVVDITDLKVAHQEIKLLQGIIPICSYCKQIRDDKGAWSELENYIESHSEVQFSHGICDKCVEEHWGKEIDENRNL